MFHWLAHLLRINAKRPRLRLDSVTDQVVASYVCETCGRETPANVRYVGPFAEPVRNGLKAFPDCVDCQCYPEGRLDCPDNARCRLTLGMLPGRAVESRAVASHLGAEAKR